MRLPIFFSSKSRLLALAISLLATGTILTLPHPAAALSCLNPAEMIEQYATEDSYTVALITAGTIETNGDEHDQIITTNTVYKGELAATDTVSFAFNETWNYLCAGEPAAEGTQAMYVLSGTQVVQVFTPDSELAQDLQAAIGTPTVPPATMTSKEAQRQSLMKQVIQLLQQIISLLS